MEKKQYILNLSCNDQVGIVAAVTGGLADKGLFILELSQYSDPTTGQFFMRIYFETTIEVSEKEVSKAFDTIAKQFKMTWDLHDKGFRPKVLLMVSKHSHCLNGILYRWSNGSLPVEIAAVVSNHADLEKMASWYNVPFHLIPITSENKSIQEDKLLQLVEKEGIDLIVLARYMQILTEKLCQKMSGRIINIHHSFLPSFKGAKPYHQAFDRGVKIIGATAHYVTADLDEGPIIDQETIRVRHDQTAKELVQLGQDIECQVLARAVKWHIEQRVILNGQKTVVFN
ncbi:MAG: formyltetrahydrofolate deformylase [Simkaniaceae bacterium]|nr:MAG: formyltetrahydrofolate deformylase [Simkaniaceae bacterium]